MIPILYEERGFLVCLKPPGLLSQSGPGDDLLQALSRQAGGSFLPVHRLDRGVGGVMAVARSKSAAAALSAAVAQRKFEKEYLCLVRGRPLEEAGTYRDLLLHDRQRNKSFVVDRMRGGVKEAELDYRCLASSGGCLWCMSASAPAVPTRSGSSSPAGARPWPGTGSTAAVPGRSLCGATVWRSLTRKPAALWPSPPCPRAGCGRSSLWRHFYQLPYKCDRVVPDPLPRNGRLAALPRKHIPIGREKPPRLLGAGALCRGGSAAAAVVAAAAAAVVAAATAAAVTAPAAAAAEQDDDQDDDPAAAAAAEAVRVTHR